MVYRVTAEGYTLVLTAGRDGVVRAEPCFSPRFLVDNEFAHIHRHAGHSLHLVLPVEVGAITDSLGWTERHPLAVARHIPATNHLLYGARDPNELAAHELLLRVSHAFAFGSGSAADA